MSGGLLDEFDRVTATQPCPVCGRKKYCLVARQTDDDRVICTRDDSGLEWPGADGWMHHVDGTNDGAPREPKARRPRKVHKSLEQARRAIERKARSDCGPTASVVTSFPYEDQDGQRCLIKYRVEWQDEDKNTQKVYIPASVEGAGWVLGTPRDVRVPLFNLPDLLEADRDAVVFITEGEKAAKALIDRGVLATTCHQSSAPRRSDLSVLKGRSVVILPDNDEKGKQIAEALAEHVLRAGAAEIRICNIPGLPPKGDAYEFVQAQPSGASIPDELDRVVREHGRPVGLPFDLYEARDLRDRKKREMLIDGVLASRSLGAVVGASSSGKSFLVLSMALSIQTGSEWMSWATQQGSVCWIAAEGFEEMAERISEWERRTGLDAGDLKILDGSPNLADHRSVGDLTLTIRAHFPEDPTLIVIDTLADTFGHGDENSTRDMRLYIQGMKILQDEFPSTSIVVIHHTGHDRSRERGSSALRAAMDVMFMVEDRGGGLMRVQKVKQRYRLEFQERWFNRIEGEKSCYLVAADVPNEVETNAILEAQDDQRVLSVLREQPGLSTKALCSRCRIGKTKWHNTVRPRLVSAGKIRSSGGRNKQCWFLTGESPVSAESPSESAGA